LVVIIMRYAVIENGIVVNTIVADEGFAAGIGAVRSDEAQIGWLWDGEEFSAPEPSPENDPVPTVVSRLQAKAALFHAGLLSQVEAAISEADPIVQMAWADAIEFRRHSPVILAMADELNLSEAQVDDLFRSASLIEI
jgi:hypothetical protein